MESVLSVFDDVQQRRGEAAHGTRGLAPAGAQIGALHGEVGAENECVGVKDDDPRRRRDERGSLGFAGHESSISRREWRPSRSCGFGTIVAIVITDQITRIGSNRAIGRGRVRR